MSRMWWNGGFEKRCGIVAYVTLYDEVPFVWQHVGAYSMTVQRESDRDDHREVWEWLLEHGPATFEEVREQFHEDVDGTVRDLMRTGHASGTIDRRVKGRETDNLLAGTSPFGAGGGTYEGDPP